MTKNEILTEAYQSTLFRNRCTVALSMGVGKTFLGLQHMDSFKFNSDKPKHNFLVVIPKNSIKQTWLDEMDKHGFSYLKDHVTFSTYRSLNKQSFDYDCIYLDEVHNLSPSHVIWLSEYPNKILGLTGTPPKSKKSIRHQLIDLYCPIVYEYLVKDAVNDNILNDYQIIVHELELSDNEYYVSLPNGARFKTTEIKEYDRLLNKISAAVSHQDKEKAYILMLRNLMDFKTKTSYVKKLLKHIDGKCIIFANTHKQADEICTYTYHSSNPNSKRNLQWFTDGMIETLSCVAQLNEGINISDLKNGIILHSYANERKTAQRIGRLLRLPVDETAVIHILVYKNTLDEVWLNKALEQFDQDKIYYAITEKIK